MPDRSSLTENLTSVSSPPKILSACDDYIFNVWRSNVLARMKIKVPNAPNLERSILWMTVAARHQQPHASIV